MITEEYKHEDSILFEQVGKTDRPFYVTLSILALFIGLATVAYVFQLRHGLGVTGLSRQIFWGVYITNFVFFIGISHAGALIAAILRLSKAEWRRPITRAAEIITVLALSFGVLNIIIDLGKPERVFNIIRYPQPQSPLVWDIIAVTVYLTASSFYLYLALIPDIAYLRDLRVKPRWLYQTLSVGWKGTERQLSLFKKSSGFMAVLVIPVAVTVHTVISFIFAMTIQPMWHSAVLAPYFVVGAIFSGIASLILVMTVVRYAYKLQDYVKPAHFNNLGILLLVMALLWLYFTITEHLTAFYGNEPVHMTVFWSKFTGEYAILFWPMFFLCFVIPFSILCTKKFRTISGTTVASIAVLIGMWLERYTIIVPTLTSQRLAIGQPIYLPTWIEWSILAGSISFFVFLFILFTKLFPIISVSEVREGKEEALSDFKARIDSYFPVRG
jgi:molybdopterin-containing oxidoreductase family membrane subunit